MNSLAQSEKDTAMSSKTLSVIQDTASASSQNHKLDPLLLSVPLTQSEAESLRKEMSEAMDWAEKELAKD
jgi:hypothetical protein